MHYDVIVFNGPGQVEVPITHAVSVTHHWKEPVGVSLGGCLAMLAAAFDTRIQRVGTRAACERAS